MQTEVETRRFRTWERDTSSVPVRPWNIIAKYGFIRMLRSGHRPDGTQISKVMPFMSLGAMSDVDMGALHLFLKSVPAREAGNR